MGAHEKYPVEKVMDALERTGGNRKAASVIIGCDRGTVAEYIKRYGLEDYVAECEDTTGDVAEYGLIKALHREEPWAIKYYLTNKGQRRGYGTLNIRATVSEPSWTPDDVSFLTDAEDEETWTPPKERMQ